MSNSKPVNAVYLVEEREKPDGDWYVPDLGTCYPVVEEARGVAEEWATMQDDDDKTYETRVVQYVRVGVV